MTGEADMKAWVLKDIGEIEYSDIEMPDVHEGEVLLKVMAAGICGSDIPRIYKTGAHRMPLIPGHEFSGVVMSVGEGVSESWLDKRVGVFPLIPCGKCIPCQKKQYEMCRDYSYLGSRRDGGFAEYVAVPEANLIELPANVSYEDAAMLEPMAVARHACSRVDTDKGHNVVVCGLGTIGMMIVMLLAEKGIENIFVIGNKDFQKEAVLRLGISKDNYCDAGKEDVSGWIMKHTDDNGADIFFECVGKNETVLLAVDNAAPGGSVCLVGNPYSDMIFDKQVYWKILRHQLEVTGTWNSSFTGDEEDDWHVVLKLIKEECIKPSQLISHKMKLEQLETGFKIMRDKSEDYVKIMAVAE